MLAVVMSVTSSFLRQEGEDRIDQLIVKFVGSVIPPAPLSTNLSTSAGESNSRVPTTESEKTNQFAGAQGDTSGKAKPSLAEDERVVAARKGIARKINEYIQNTRSGALGVTGSILLIFAAISMLTRIEGTFNDIWGVTRGRSWFMRIVLYWGVLSLAPLLVVVALGLATGSHLESTKGFLYALPFGNLLFHFSFQFLPVLVLCLTFAAFYMLMPNVKVRWSAALVGGFVGGGLLHLNNLVNVLYVSRVVSNSKIYGSLGLVPVLMIGLYFAWLILLFGAQVSYAYQNRATYLEEKQAENINQRGREFVALRLMTLVGQRYLKGNPPIAILDMATELCIPTRLVHRVMQALAAARLVVEVAGQDTAYVPARPMETINCHDILMAMRASQGQELTTRDDTIRSQVYGEYQRIEEAERQVASRVTLLTLSHRAQDQLSEEPNALLR
jgi:membrane protein